MNTVLETPPKTWTETELQALSEDGYIHEVVNGNLVMSPKNNWQHGDICVRLIVAMATYVRERRLGAVFDSSTGFWMHNRNCRAPDVSFVRKDRLKNLDRSSPAFFQGAPDLAVEILSPSMTRRDMDERLNDFFASGTRLAWVIDPARELAEICHSPTERRLLGSGGSMAAEYFLPGFLFPVSDLFEEWKW